MSPKWLGITGGFAAGVAVSAVALLLAASLLLKGGFSARNKPGAVEAYAARFALHHAVSERDRALRNPVPFSQAAPAEGRDHFADHCASCHANNGDGHTMFGDGLNPPPPDLRLPATQEKSDGELYSIIQNGVRMTGMPAFGSGGAQDESTWKLVAFIRHLPKLTRDEELAMQRANPISPTELQEQQEEDNFLKGQKQ